MFGRPWSTPVGPILVGPILVGWTPVWSIAPVPAGSPAAPAHDGRKAGTAANTSADPTRRNARRRGIGAARLRARESIVDDERGATAPRVYNCSQKMTMIPWNAPSGPNSGNAVVAISRSTPSRPVIHSRA